LVRRRSPDVGTCLLAIAGGDGWGQLIVQTIASLATLAYSFVGALVIGYATKKNIGFRVKDADETAGIDRIIHGEDGHILDAEIR
jgi:Amt family ammonium transporter